MANKNKKTYERYLEIEDKFYSDKYYGYIAVNRAIIKHFDDKIAIILGDILLKMNKKGLLVGEGYNVKSKDYLEYPSNLMQLHTGYGDKAQSQALNILEEEGFIHTAKDTKNNQIKVTLDYDKCLNILAEDGLKSIPKFDNKANIIFNMLIDDNAIMLNRSLLYALDGEGGTPTKALIYSQLLHRYEEFFINPVVTEDDIVHEIEQDGFFFCMMADLKKSTGYNTYKQKKALEDLKEKGLIEIERRGRYRVGSSTLNIYREEEEKRYFRKRRLESIRHIKPNIDNRIIELLEVGRKLIEEKAEKVAMIQD